jgi:hypothetical protein
MFPIPAISSELQSAVSPLSFERGDTCPDTMHVLRCSHGL